MAKFNVQNALLIILFYISILKSDLGYYFSLFLCYLKFEVWKILWTSARKLNNIIIIFTKDGQLGLLHKKERFYNLYLG